MVIEATRLLLDELYDRYNRREFVHPDPLEFVYGYADPADREIVALIASSLAYGRVAQILKSVSGVLARMSPSPSTFLHGTSRASLVEVFDAFKHRFTTGRDLADMLWGARRAIEKHGSLRECFLAGLRPGDDTILPGLAAFVDALTLHETPGHFALLPSPARGSACKRINLLLRWMVRRDDVDPGGWDRVGASSLLVPLDTHMYKIGRALNLTRRKQPDLRAAVEITAGFRTIVPDDPVRYDFALTRPGILEENDALTRLTNGVVSEVC